MFTYLNSIGKVSGSEELLGFVFLSFLVYLVVYFALKLNRTPKGRVLGVIGLICSLILSDIIWYSYFFPKGEYVNYGLGGSILPILVLPVLITLSVILTALLSKRNHKN